MRCIHQEPRAYCKRQDGCNDCDDLQNHAPAAQSASNAKVMWHRLFKPVLAGSGLIALAAWILGFSFWLFPWEGGADLEWWNIPHLVTTLLIAAWPATIGISILCTLEDTIE